MNRKYMIGLVLLASLLAVKSPVSGEETVPSQDLIKNGGFEEVVQTGTTANCPSWDFWQGYHNTNGEFVIQWDSKTNGEFAADDVHSGKYACKLKEMGATQEIKVKAKEGDILHIRFWAKGDKSGRWFNNACGCLHLTVSQYLKDQRVITNQIVEGSAGLGIGDGVALGAEWKQHFCRVEIAGECDRIKLAFNPTWWSSNVWLDDVSATLGGSITKVTCPSPWHLGYINSNGDGEAEFVTNDVHSGKYACKLKGSVSATQEIKAKAGDILHISSWAKGDKDAPQVRNNMYGSVNVTLSQYREGKCVSTYGPVEVVLARDEWKQCSAWLKVPPGDYDRVEVKFSPSDWSGTVLLDGDVSAMIAGSIPNKKGRVNVKAGKRIVVRKIAADSKSWNYFPWLCRTINGNLINWCGIVQDGVTPAPGVEIQRRMLSSDNGKTWQDIGGETEGFMTHILHDGTVLGLANLSCKGDGWVTKTRRSKDNGKTYSIEEVPVAIEHVRQDGATCVQAGLVETDNGGWLATMYVDLEGRPKCSCVLLRSTNKGKSWDYFSTIAYDPEAPGLGFCEPAMIRTGPESLLAMMRTWDNGPCDPMCQARSTDGGKTWSKTTIVADHGVMPDLAMTDDGILVCSYGRPGVNVICSPDGQGNEWTDDTVIFPTGQTTGYTKMVKTGPNDFLLTYDALYGYTDPEDNKPYSYIFIVPLTIERVK